MAQDNPHTSNPARTAIHLRILHTSDLHGALRGYDYLADKACETSGLARTATLMRTARAGTGGNVMLFDSGDVIQGSPVCDLVAETGLTRDQVHPMIAMMNQLGYDALTPGNHDFNHGADFLFRALKDARFPVVCSNFRHREDRGRRLVYPPYVILRRTFPDQSGTPRELRVAVLGCLPPQTIDWDHRLAGTYATDCMVAATKAAVKAARSEGCDLTILLAHAGIDPQAPEERAENAVIDLAALDGIDIVLGGHTHRVFPAPPEKAPQHPAIDNGRGLIHGKPVLLSGFGGNHLGQVDLVLIPDGGGWKIASSLSRHHALVRRDNLGRIWQRTPEDTALRSATGPIHSATLRYIRAPVGESRRPLHSFFSFLANDASVQLVARAQARFVQRAVAGSPLADLPLLSSAAPFKTGRLGGPDHFTHIPAGPLSRRAVTDLYAFPNTICALKVSGHQLGDWLEHSASLFSHIPHGPGQDLPLLIESFPGYRFDVIAGVTYEIDLSQPPRYDARLQTINPATRRIRNLCFNGLPVGDDQEFLVVSNSYRVYGTGFGAQAPQVVFEENASGRDVLLAYIREQTPIDFPVRPIWSFAPLGGATARFETAPLARAYLDDPMLPPLEDLGDTPDGFASFRVTL